MRNINNIKGTLYNPSIHGIMTDAERASYNKGLLASLPEYNVEDMIDYFDYKSYVEARMLKEAEECKEGYERYVKWRSRYNEILEKILYTEDEFNRLNNISDRCMNKASKELENEGIYLSADAIRSCLQIV